MRSVNNVVTLALCSVVLWGCELKSVSVAVGNDPPARRFEAQLARTSFGVPHVRAADFSGIGYGLAYAYAQDNVCMLADSLLTVRGERSRFFGPDARATLPVNGEYGAAIDYIDLSNADSDFFFKGYIDLEQLRRNYAAGNPEVMDLLAGYVAGYNRFLRDHAGRLPAACHGAPWVKPMSVDDMFLVLAEKALHATGEVFAQEIVNAARAPGLNRPAAPTSMQALDPGIVQRRLQRLTGAGLGSNAIAIGRDLSASGRGLLLGNPHYPWTSTDRFYQAHLTIPGRYDAMGVVLGGIPMVVIGFNRNVAWTHTVTKAVHFTTFKLALDPRDPTGTTYLVDGVAERMTAKEVSIDVLQADRTVARRSKTFYFTRYGAVLVFPQAGIAWTASEVTVLGDPNRNNTRLLEQWIAIGSAGSAPELKAALDRHVGLPWVNTVAADRFGNALYADASVVPRMTTDRFGSDCLLLPALLLFDGSRSVCTWGNDPLAPQGIFSPVNAPWMLRPDYVANSNDSYWLSNARALLEGPGPLGYSPLYGPTKVPQSLRTRIGFQQLEEKIAERRLLQLADLQELAFANRVPAAELLLPELLPRCQTSVDATVLAACSVLSAWDRKNNLDSRGAVLFREMWRPLAGLDGLWAVPFDPRDPVNTPRSLTQSATPLVMDALRAAALRMNALGVPLDGRLGDYQHETRNGVRVPLHGGVGELDGSYNSLYFRTGLEAGGYFNVAWGTSYVQTVTFDAEGPVAHGMLVYGQSVDPRSAHYADQLPVFSRKEWPRLPFSEAQVRADPNYTVMSLRE